MNLLPLVTRELRAAMRRPHTSRIRMAAGSAVMCASCWALLVWGAWTSGGSLGLSLLRALAWAGFVGALLGGAILTADSLSQEKREATMELLLATGLGHSEIVFGKLAGKIVIPFYALLGIFPGFAVCFVVGGVTGGECWRLLMVLVNTLFFALSAGLFTSSLCRQQRPAYSSAILLILLTAAAIPFCGAGLSSWAKNSLWDHAASLLSPTGAYWLAYDAQYAAAKGWFWSSLASTHVLAWVILGLACLIPDAEPSMPHDAGRLTTASRCWARFQQPVFTRHRGDQKKLQGSNPMAWLASRRRTGALLIWSLPMAATGLLLQFELNPFGPSTNQISFLIWFAIHLLFKIWLAGDAAHTFASDRRSGALELLLGTPLQPLEMAVGVVRAFQYRFVRPIITLFLLNVFLALRLVASGETAAAVTVCAGAILFLLDCYSLCWVGLWRGLASRHPAVATIGTIGRVLVLPWAWLGLIASLFARSTPLELTAAWALVNGLNDLVILSGAKHKLNAHFRAMALRPYGEKAPYLESKWSAMNWEPTPDHPHACRQGTEPTT